MLKLFKFRKSSLFIIILIPLMTLVSFFIYLEYVKTKEDVFKIIKEYLIDEKLELFENYSELIIQDLGENIQKTLDLNQDLCLTYENKLRLIEGREIKYLYLLKQDVNGDFRFLLDATLDLDEKAQYNQKFYPQSDIWQKAYKTKKVQIVHQKDLEQLWVSIAYPIVLNSKVIALLGADFTYDVYTKIVETLNPLERLYVHVSIFMLIMLIVAYSLVYLYYKTRRKGFIDPLTKIYNRQYLAEFLEINAVKDYHIMMIDLDHFKDVNDHYGHDTGDEVLIIITQRIQNTIRKEDVLIRFGGEEFLLFVYKQEIMDSIEIANRIREAVMESTIYTNNNQINMTISIGVNPYPEYSKNIEEAIKIADEQLYVAKSSGRNRVEVLSEFKNTRSKMSKRISDIQEAIDEDRIQCAFQAIYTNENTKATKYEILIRLIDSNGDVIMPNEFLPSIRNTQVYVHVTSIVVDKAIEVLENNDISVSINLDLQDILNDTLIDMFKNKLEHRYELAQRLTIEILEHEEITNFTIIKEKIQIFKDMGLLIALDDFGSGYANFSYFINLDIDILKIDGSIIKNIDKNESRYFIVESIVNFAKKMNILTVAEQIETQEEFNTLKELEVDYYQGYYLGRPKFELD